MAQTENPRSPIYASKPFAFVAMEFGPSTDARYEGVPRPVCTAAGFRCDRVDKQVFKEKIIDRT